MKSAASAKPHPVTPDVQGLRVPERTVALLRDLIASQAGIHYDDDRLDLLKDRLAPLAIERGFDSLLDYYYLLKYDAAAPQEWIAVMDALSVQETYFWREADQLLALASTIMPILIEQRRSPIRIWSIPCATGEEPLSIAMALTEASWFDRAAIEIYASDASESALARAQRRCYGRRAFRVLPEAMRDRYFTRQGDREEWMVESRLFARITAWDRVNVMQPHEVQRHAGADVIFCRNMFIYFSPGGVREVAARFAHGMPSPGYLCVGASESLLRTCAGFDLQDFAGAYVYVKP